MILPRQGAWHCTILLLSAPVWRNYFYNGFIGVHAFSHSRQSPITSSLSSSPLPPPLKRKAKRKPMQTRNNRIGYGTTDGASGPSHRPWKGQAIPKDIPRLSTVLRGEAAPPTTRQRPTTTTKKTPGVAVKQRKRNNERPWNAGYYTSIKSQKRIQAAGGMDSQHRNNRRPQQRLPIQRATAVLETFLSISPYKCNAANLVCALTLSAKIMSSPSSSSNAVTMTEQDNFRSLVFRTNDVLLQMLNTSPSASSSSTTTTANPNNSNIDRPCLLSARQLCNAAWALAKHYDRDASFLPTAPHAPAPTVVSKTATVAETWDLRHESAGNPTERVDRAVDAIATCLTTLLWQEQQESSSRLPTRDGSTTTTTTSATAPTAVKEGELAMACWAYGVMRRRRRPPGWQQGPRIGTLEGETSDSDGGTAKGNAGAGIIGESDYIKFEQWGSSAGNDDSVSEEANKSAPPDLDEPSVTGILLDHIGAALCTPLAENDIISRKETDFLHDVERTDAPVVRRVRRCTWSELANVAWAFASHGRASSEDAQNALAAIATEATRRLRDNAASAHSAKSRDIAQIVWALGTLQTDNFRLADSLIKFIDAVAAFTSVHGENQWNDRPFRRWNCADIVQVTLSLAHARLDEVELLQSLYSEALSRLQNQEEGQRPGLGRDRNQFLVWEISVLLWAQARFHLQGRVYDGFCTKAVTATYGPLKRGATFHDLGIGPQEQANIAWSLTVLQRHDTQAAQALLKRIFEQAAVTCKQEGVIQLEHAHQLWQALFLLEDECPECVTTVPEWFREYLRNKWFLEKARPKVSSARHKSLSKTLGLMGVAHYNEHDEDIDVAIVLKSEATWTHETERSSIQDGVRVAVEFDGPNHFTRQRKPTDGSRPEPPRALGHTVLKYRLLKRQGWTVVRVPYYEYDKIPFWASMERQRYVQRQLKTHGNLQFSDVDVSEYKVQSPNRQTRFD